ncbi:UDP-N-acetylmuramoylalanine--D-glutamate ligase [Candidatus Desulfarcum epimagneticum]|uniref:UDP-N-acetylmuramoylalanine--D-glutamate ligase n=1 Tax=uncultured Desulfobacteraceae bacterium TaxID=218296 RepID=A0A484HJI2_9BACT|nr:UDP-N-acetylmuramoylalanine--D-glutamate ligase [uncultured Desulfobacteraceae bacterium]
MKKMSVAGKKFLVAGLGKSGLAAARFLKDRGGRVTAADSAGPEKLGRFFEAAREAGIALELAERFNAAFEDAERIVISPGIPHDIEPVQRARERGVSVIGEIELASRFIPAPIAAITGTNGKTTVATLVGRMLEESGARVYVGGNIGTPLIDCAGSHEKYDVVVAEISSFQLETVETFKPKTAVMLNITEDHLDRHRDMDTYAGAKARIFENQDSTDFAVLNGFDPQVLERAAGVRSTSLVFGGGKGFDGAAALQGKRIVFGPAVKRLPGFARARDIDLGQAGLVGRHNHENIAASFLAAAASGGTFEGALAALESFGGLPHRIQRVGAVDGADYYNDSKATNADAALRALEAFDRPVVLIMGGRDKNADFAVLSEAIRKRVKTLVVMGEAAKKIESALGYPAPIKRAGSMEEAVFMAHGAARPGDVVLLSPGCASFDMYESYAARGEDFARAVHEIKGRRHVEDRD